MTCFRTILLIVWLIELSCGTDSDSSASIDIDDASGGVSINVNGNTIHISGEGCFVVVCFSYNT